MGNIFLGGSLKNLTIFMGFSLTKYALFLVFTKILHIFGGVLEITGILGRWSISPSIFFFLLLLLGGGVVVTELMLGACLCIRKRSEYLGDQVHILIKPCIT